MRDLAVRGWPYLVGGVLGVILGRYTDAPWLIPLAILALIVLIIRRHRRRTPPA